MEFPITNVFFSWIISFADETIIIELNYGKILTGKPY